MSTGQSFLTIGALMLIGTIILNFNRAINEIDSSLDYNRYRVEALSLLTSHIEQVSLYYFDECSTDTITAKRLNDFTLPNRLGFENNDNSVLDDLDDLSGTTVSDTGLSGVIYHVDYRVDYVTMQGNRFIISEARTYHKQVSIDVSDAYNPPMLCRSVNGEAVRDTLSVEIIVSYWFYN